MTPTITTPIVWPVIGTGLNGIGIEIWAKIAIKKDPSIIDTNGDNKMLGKINFWLFKMFNFIFIFFYK
tara:strand:+ start:1130 stop:1333 length:204 start_codon:yes stop_codon:yes gene_type:complete